LVVIVRVPKSLRGEAWIKMISWFYWIFFVTAGQQPLALHGAPHGVM
jgi:hypothetical protein